jgi:ABC-type glycerol-3-phosphate transport system permease component
VTAWRREYGRLAPAFLLPALLLLGTFVVWPLLRASWWSLHDTDLLASERQRWVGLAQYSDLLRDARFRRAFANTALFALMVVPAQTLLAFLLALWVARPEPAWRWLRSAFFVPTVMAMPAPRDPVDDLFTAHDWTLANYANGFRRAGLAQALTNSLLQVGVIGAGGLLVNSMAAYAFARLSCPGRDALFAAVVALIVLPVEVLAVPLFLTARDLGLTGSPAAVYLGLTVPFVAKAFNIYFLRQHFLALPTDLEEAAVLDGASVWQQFWRIALPALRPALVTVVLLDALVHWSDFLWPLLMTTRESTRTVQIGLANLFTEPPVDWGAILACAVLATLPVLLAFRFLQRFLVVTDARSGLR